LNNERYYDEDIRHDYPSIEELDAALLTNHITPIFAISVEGTNTYQELSNIMSTKPPYAFLSKDKATNIIEILQKTHEVKTLEI
jgi:mevalonate pyrophosphate decarboxylase